MAGHKDVQTTIQDTLDRDFTLVISHKPDVAESQSFFARPQIILITLHPQKEREIECLKFSD